MGSIRLLIIYWWDIGPHWIFRKPEPKTSYTQTHASRCRGQEVKLDATSSSSHPDTVRRDGSSNFRSLSQVMDSSVKQEWVYRAKQQIRNKNTDLDAPLQPYCSGWGAKKTDLWYQNFRQLFVADQTCQTLATFYHSSFSDAFTEFYFTSPPCVPPPPPKLFSQDTAEQFSTI